MVIYANKLSSCNSFTGLVPIADDNEALFITDTKTWLSRNVLTSLLEQRKFTVVRQAHWMEKVIRPL